MFSFKPHGNQVFLCHGFLCHDLFYCVLSCFTLLCHDLLCHYLLCFRSNLMETKSNQKVEHFLSQFVFSCLGLGVFFRRALIPASPGFVGIPGAFCRKSRRGGG